MKQSQVFLTTEGDAYFERNRYKTKNFDDDPIVIALQKIWQPSDETSKSVLEIGCGEGHRLEWLKSRFPCEVYGIDPSAKAVEQACRRGVEAQQGTAEHLPFEAGYFDVLIFGFCLYVCDPDDLFQIAQEAHRVLKKQSWLLIYDFFAPALVKNEYQHSQGLFSHKMDYRRLFDWHPAYTCFSHEIRHHSEPVYTDDSHEWTALSVLRKFS